MADLIDESDAPERANRIKSAPHIRNVYWCELWADARKPEFWKRRPVIVVSYKNTLPGPCLVVPLTTKEQPGNPWAYKLPYNYVSPGLDSWVICNHLMTVSVSRLSAVKGTVPRLTEAEFQPLVVRVLSWLPKIRVDMN